MAEADPGKTFSLDDAALDLGAAIKRAHGGEVIVLMKDGRPYAQLAPYGAADERAGNVEALEKPRRRQPGALKGKLGNIPDSVWFDPLPEDDLAAWEGRYSNIL